MDIRIEKPCPESWDAMTPHEVGKHCAVCEKTVYDFTGKPKEELLAFLLCSAQTPCVRMLASQQHFTSEEVLATVKEMKRKGITIPAAAVSLLLLAASCNSIRPSSGNNHALMGDVAMVPPPDTTQVTTIDIPEKAAVVPLAGKPVIRVKEPPLDAGKPPVTNKPKSGKDRKKS